MAGDHGSPVGDRPASRHRGSRRARDGRLVILRTGKPADPSHRIKGVIRLALPGDGRP
ncbi:MAG TPA: DUF3253 domain-containing protein [Kiloniellales bacterium]